MQSIRRGTTPTIHFALGIEEADAESLYMTITQDGRRVLEKASADAQWDEMGVFFVLSQQDTLNLKTGFASVQIRVKLVNNLAAATQILPLKVDGVLKNEVI